MIFLYNLDKKRLAILYMTVCEFKLSIHIIEWHTLKKIILQI